MVQIAFSQKDIGSIIQSFLHLPTLRRGFLVWLSKVFNIILTTRNSIVNKPDSSIKVFEFGSEQQINLTLPVTVTEVPSVLNIPHRSITLSKPFVAEFSGAKLVGVSAVGIDCKGHVIMETVLPDRDDGTPAFEALPIRTFLSKWVPAQELKKADCAVSLVNFWGRTVYSHWILDCLTRLEGVEHYQKVTGIKPKLIIGSNPKSWQLESLQMLGYDEKDLIFWEGKPLKVEQLIVPSFRRQCRWPEASSIEWLRQRLRSSLKNYPSSLSLSPKVYISRANASGRRILNEKEVLAALTPLGFVSYTLEEMSFADEVRLFSQAETIVGVHGSGLSNMVYANPQTLVVDLFSPQYYTPSFFKTANSLGHRYACLPCTPAGNDVRRSRNHLIVDIDKLKLLVHQMSCESSIAVA